MGISMEKPTPRTMGAPPCCHPSLLPPHSHQLSSSLPCGALMVGALPFQPETACGFRSWSWTMWRRSTRRLRRRCVERG